jgi:DNA-binding transcriptional ArsR family regulator
MKVSQAIKSLGALAHEYRLAIFRLLIRNGPEGLPAGSIGSRVNLTPSSLTFHLQALQRAGLIHQSRVGRQLFYSADFTAMTDLVRYLTDECCIESGSCDSVCDPARPSKKSKAA